MSIRSVIEINHDYGDQLVDRGYISEEFWRFIRERGVMWRINGAKHLGQVHHTEEVELKRRGK